MSERISDERLKELRDSDPSVTGLNQWLKAPSLLEVRGMANDLLAARATITKLEARIALLEKALADDNEAGHLALASHERDQARIRELEQAILWADGRNGEFQPRRDGDGPYWWRHELMRRAGCTALAKPEEVENG